MISNIAFFILTTKTTDRPSLLTKKDFVEAKKIVRKGDVILAGDFRRISHFFTGNIFTHTLLYADKNKCIHASVDGVGTISFDKLFEEYDTLIIMRPNISDSYYQTINKVIEFARHKIGSAYNFYFEYRQDRYVCTQLVASSFQESGVNLNIKYKKRSRRDKFFVFSRMRKVIKADDFLAGDFKVLFASKEIKKPNRFSNKNNNSFLAFRSNLHLAK